MVGVHLAPGVLPGGGGGEAGGGHRRQEGLGLGPQEHGVSPAEAGVQPQVPGEVNTCLYFI